MLHLLEVLPDVSRLYVFSRSPLPSVFSAFNLSCAFSSILIILFSKPVLQNCYLFNRLHLFHKPFTFYPQSVSSYFTTRRLNFVLIYKISQTICQTCLFAYLPLSIGQSLSTFLTPVLSFLLLCCRIFVVGIGFFSLCFLMTSLGGQFSAKRLGDSPFTIRTEGTDICRACVFVQECRLVCLFVRPFAALKCFNVSSYRCAIALHGPPGASLPCATLWKLHHWQHKIASHVWMRPSLM